MKYPQLLRSSGLCLCFLLAASILPQADAAAHIVRSGETLSSIGRQHHVSVRALTRANPRVNPHLIFQGQAIRLPDNDAPRGASGRKTTGGGRKTSAFESASLGGTKPESESRSRDAKTSKSAPVTAKATSKKSAASKSPARRDDDDNGKTPAKSKSGVSAITRYKVQKGDTLFTIAGKNGTSVKQLMAMNKLSDSHLSLGQSLLVPVVGGRGAAREVPKEKPSRRDDEHAVDISPPPPRQRSGQSADRDTDSSSSRGSRKPESSPRKRDRDDDDDAPRGVYYHIVKRDEDFSSIAAQHGVSWGDLYRANRGITPEALRLNQRIAVPREKTRSIQAQESSRTQLASRRESSSSSRARQTPAPASKSLASSRSPSRLADTTISMEPPPPVSRKATVEPDDPLPPLVTRTEETAPVEEDDGVVPMTAYKVAPNETIDDIAKEFSTTREELRKINHMGGFDQPIPGNYVVVPWTVPSAMD